MEAVIRPRTLLSLTALGVLGAALWWRKNPSACPYSQRFWVEAPHPGITRKRLLDILAPRPAERVIRKLVPWERPAERLVGLVEGIRHGLSALRSPSRLAGVIAWSLALWLLNALSFYVGFLAFDIPVGVSAALLLQGVVVFGIAVPSTPGYVGLFESAIKAVLLLFAVTPDRAVPYAVTYHVTTFLPIVLLGAWSLLATSMSLRDLRAASSA